MSLPATGLRAVFRPVPLAVIAGIAAAVTLYVFDPSRSSFYPGCIFYRTTGLLCPGCGCLRALHQLLHGHLAEALHCNPLLIITLFAALILAGRAVLISTLLQQGVSWWCDRENRFNGFPRPVESVETATSRAPNTPLKQGANEMNGVRRCGRHEVFGLDRFSQHPGWLWAYLGIVLAFWVLRNLPGPLFTLLRP